MPFVEFASQEGLAATTTPAFSVPASNGRVDLDGNTTETPKPRERILRKLLLLVVLLTMLAGAPAMAQSSDYVIEAENLPGTTLSASGDAIQFSSESNLWINLANMPQNATSTKIIAKVNGVTQEMEYRNASTASDQSFLVDVAMYEVYEDARDVQVGSDIRIRAENGPYQPLSDEDPLIIDKIVFVGGGGTSLPPEPTGLPAGDTSKPDATQSLQSMIDNAASGDTITVPGDRVYREQVNINKPLTLKGEPGAEVRGSKVWSNWSASGNDYISSNSVPALDTESRWICEGSTSKCKWPEQVFIDGAELEQVSSDPRSGQFSVNSNRKVILGENPAGKMVEVTEKNHFMDVNASNVTIDNLDGRHAGNRGLFSVFNDNVTVKNSDYGYAHTTVVNLNKGDNLRVENSEIHHGGQLGVHSNLPTSFYLIGNDVHRNNTQMFKTGWEAGGTKVSQPGKAYLLNNEIHHDYWGLWTDTPNANQSEIVFDGNRVHHTVWGLRAEVTKNFRLTNNVLYENGWQGTSRQGGAIIGAASHDGVVENNKLAWNARGLHVNAQNRKAGQENYDITRNVKLRQNEVAMDCVSGEKECEANRWYKGPDPVSPNIYAAVNNNGGGNNKYWYENRSGGQLGENSTERFQWETPHYKLSTWTNTPAGTGDTYFAARPDVFLEANDIPLTPER